MLKNNDKDDCNGNDDNNSINDNKCNENNGYIDD